MTNKEAVFQLYRRFWDERRIAAWMSFEGYTDFDIRNMRGRW